MCKGKILLNKNAPTEGTLMVTITLDEYRKLVQESTKLSHYIGETIKLEKENVRLKDENVELSARADEAISEFKRLLAEKRERENAVEQVQNNV